MTTERITPEAEKMLRETVAHGFGLSDDEAEDLFAMLDAVRVERDKWRKMWGEAQRARDDGLQYAANNYDLYLSAAKDVARLDWLESCEFVSTEIRVLASDGLPARAEFYRDRYEDALTLREMIDAAMIESPHVAAGQASE